MNRRVRLLFLLFLSHPLVAAGTEILLVGARPDHPHGTHMYAFECALLRRCLENQEGVNATYVEHWPPREELLATAESIVFYSNPAGSMLLAEPHREQFDALMRKGVGFVAIHWGTCVGYDKVSEAATQRDIFKSWLGGWFRRPPCDIKIGQAVLRQIDPSHPINRGWTGWNIRDEFYLRPVLHDQAVPLLEVNIEDQRHVVGWTLERNPGRSVGITLGHFHQNFIRDEFRRMIVNGILWSANLEIPSDGSSVQVEDDRLVLPKTSAASP